VYRTITLCAAQLVFNDGSPAVNLEKHLNVLRLAAGRGVHCVVFPELSLTGYCVREARARSLAPDAPEIEALRIACDELGLSAIVGMPLREGRTLSIAACVCRPGLSVTMYRKQNLHGEEHTVYTPGSQPCVVPIHGYLAGYAVCADTDNPVLAMAARELGAELYLAGVVSGERSHADTCATLEQQARANAMTILMANHAGPTGRYVGAGGSTIWKANGTVAVQGPMHEECLVICAMDDDGGYAGTVLAL
jgi:Predicted amidohydrolase